ncbi:MAG: hypothetical protein ACKPKO_14540, partial [Candidatus Fonsibacter sp.]
RCPHCQQEFTNGQNVAKYRCGHVARLDCFDYAVHRGRLRCTYCRRSGTARTDCAIINPVPDEDIGVSIQPENGVAAAAAAASSSDDFIPRHVVIKTLSEQHQDNIEGFDNEIGRLIDRLLICRDRRDKRKELLK